jgi:hypothetical protein
MRDPMKRPRPLRRYVSQRAELWFRRTSRTYFEFDKVR